MVNVINPVPRGTRRKTRTLQYGDKVEIRLGNAKPFMGVYLGKSKKKTDFARYRQYRSKEVKEAHVSCFSYVPSLKEIWKIAKELREMSDEERHALGLQARMIEESRKQPNFKFKYNPRY